MSQVFDRWSKAFTETVEGVKTFLAPPSSEDEESTLYFIIANWLMSLDEHALYELLPNYRDVKDNIFECYQMLSSLHHGLVDDGELSFVTMYNGDTIASQFIAFRNAYDADFETFCRDSQHSIIVSLQRSYDSLVRLSALAKTRGANMNEPKPPAIRFETTDALTFLWRYHEHTLQSTYDDYRRTKALQQRKSATTAAVVAVVPTPTHSLPAVVAAVAAPSASTIHVDHSGEEPFLESSSSGP